MSSRPRSACTVIGWWWVLVTGDLPPFEACCQDHDLCYATDEYDLAVAEGWGRAFCDLHFGMCVRERFARETWWDWLCYWAVRGLGWLCYHRHR